MIYAYSNSTQTVPANGVISFNNTAIRTGCTVTKNGTTNIELNKPGFYEVSFNGDFTGTVITSLQLYVNGVLYPGAEATVTPSAEANTNTGSFTTLVQVTPQMTCNCANTPTTLTVRNNSTASITMSNAAITVTKVC